jgi:hypothetical protein
MGIINRIWHYPLRRDDDRYFRTANLHLATILFSQGFALANVDRANPAHCLFVFPNSYDLQETVERFNSKQPIFVEAHKLLYSWKTLRNKLREERF